MPDPIAVIAALALLAGATAVVRWLAGGRALLDRLIDLDGEETG